MGIILLFHTILRCTLTGLISKRFWFSYILFLVFVGGILILFIYMSSLASNEIINFSTKPLINFILLIRFMTIITLFYDKFFILNSFFNSEIINFKFNFLIQENHLSLSKIFNSPNNFIIILLINYLLLTLIIVAKITNSFTGPLRPKKY